MLAPGVMAELLPEAVQEFKNLSWPRQKEIFACMILLSAKMIEQEFLSREEVNQVIGMTQDPKLTRKCLIAMIQCHSLFDPKSNFDPNYSDWIMTEQNPPH